MGATTPTASRLPRAPLGSPEWRHSGQHHGRSLCPKPQWPKEHRDGCSKTRPHTNGPPAPSPTRARSLTTHHSWALFMAPSPPPISSLPHSPGIARTRGPLPTQRPPSRLRRLSLAAWRHLAPSNRRSRCRSRQRTLAMPSPFAASEPPSVTSLLPAFPSPSPSPPFFDRWGHARATRAVVRHEEGSPPTWPF